MNEDSKQHLLKIGAIAIMTFIIAFLAFYIIMEIMVHRITNPAYQAKRMEQYMIKQEREFKKFNERDMENPFEPKMRPMIVNLVKEPSEYKIIVDLAALDSKEEDINIALQENELTVSGKIDKKIRNSEKIINFTQTYYLDENIEEDKITKERKGNKYIITIPFQN